MPLHTYLSPDNSNAVNNSGGVAYALDKWKALERFLILGTEGGTYYANESAHTKQALIGVNACLAEDGVRLVAQVVAVSKSFRAPKNEPAIVVLALAAKKGDDATRKAAYGAVGEVCRTGTHLFQFVSALKSLGGAGGRGAQRALSRWYTDKTPEKLAYQLVKYRSRRASEGDKTAWTHRDVLRIARPTPPKGGAMATLLNYAARGWPDIGTDPHPEKGPDMVWAYERVSRSTSAPEVARLVSDYRLPWECVPTALMNDRDVWMALLPHAGMEATVRALGRLTSIGLIAPLSDGERLVMSKFTDDAVRESRLHPLKVAVGAKTYAQGHGMKGALNWTPSGRINQALDRAYFASFGNVKPTGKRFVFGIDVSLSMSSSIGNTYLSCAEAAAILALVTARVEPYAFLGGFGTQFLDLSKPIGLADRFSGRVVATHLGAIHANMPFMQAAAAICGINGGGTDCSVPMAWATANKVPADAFVILTDNETNSGRMNPSVALRDYRRRMGIDAKLVVVGMTSTGFTIADPNDAGMLDVVGFDTSFPAALSAFVSG